MLLYHRYCHLKFHLKDEYTSILSTWVASVFVYHYGISYITGLYVRTLLTRRALMLRCKLITMSQAGESRTRRNCVYSPVYYTHACKKLYVHRHSRISHHCWSVSMHTLVLVGCICRGYMAAE